jgi:hypothetical protein
MGSRQVVVDEEDQVDSVHRLAHLNKIITGCSVRLS